MDVVVQRFVRFLGCSLKTMNEWKIQDPDIRPELKDICTTFSIQVMVIKFKHGSDCMIDANYKIFLVLMIFCKILKSHFVNITQIY